MHGELYRAILVNPDDDRLRLVYADWLEERGDSAYAEFIRAQIELNRPGLTSTRRVQLRQREQELENAYGHEWRQHLPVWAREHTDFGLIVRGRPVAQFRRGIISHLSTTVERFVERAQELAPIAPIESAFLYYEEGATLEGLARCPALQGLRSLSFAVNRASNVPYPRSGLGPAAALSLAASPYLGRLESLNLSYTAIGSRGVQALGRSSAFPRLQRLILANNDLGDEGAIFLAQSPLMSRLTDLDLGQNKIGPSGVSSLARVQPELLKRLVLRSNPFRDEGVASLVSIPFRQLSAMELGTCDLGPDSARLIGERLQLSPGASLTLDYNRMGAEGVRHLCSSTRLRLLEELSLAECAVGDEGVSLIARADWARLTSLGLYVNSIGDLGATDIAGSASLRTLVNLDLTINEIGAGGARALADSPLLLGLRSLQLSGNQIDDAGAIALAASDHMANHRELDLHSNQIGLAGAVAFVSSSRLGALTDLGLGYNPLGPGAGRALAACSGLLRLTKIRLNDAKLNDDDGEALAACPYLSNIRELWLDANRMGDRTAMALAASPYLGNVTRLLISGGHTTLTEVGRQALRQRYGERVEL